MCPWRVKIHATSACCPNALKYQCFGSVVPLAVWLNFRKYLIHRFALVDLKLLRHYGRQLRWRQWRDGQGRWWRLMRENGTTRESWWADGLFRRRILARPELSICPFPRKQMWKGKISFISNFWDVKMMMAWKRFCRFSSGWTFHQVPQ